MYTNKYTTVFLKNSGVSTQIIHFNRVFHEINHPFWGFGYPYFLGKTFFGGADSIMALTTPTEPFSSTSFCLLLAAGGGGL